MSNISIEDFYPIVAPYTTEYLPENLQLSALKPAGEITSAYFLASRDMPFTPRAGTLELHALSWQENNDIPGIKGLSGKLSFNRSGGEFEFTPDNKLSVFSTKWLADPITLPNVLGHLKWHQGEESVIFSSADLTTELESIKVKSAGSVSFNKKMAPTINIFAQISDGALTDIRKLVPKNLLPVKGERWARRAFKTGTISSGVMLFRGAISDFPFDQHEGVFQAHLSATNADIKYGAKWPIAEQIAGSFYAENRRAEFAVNAGDIYSSDVSNSFVSVNDLFTKKRYVEVRSKTLVSATEVARFIDDSPLKNTKANRFKEVTIDTPFELELDLNLGIFPGGEKDILGVAHFDGNRIESRKLKLALDDLNGDVSFTRHDWYGEGLTAEFRGNRVGVLLDGGLDDPNYETQIRLTGTSGADFILDQIKTYAPKLATIFTLDENTSRLHGRAAWKAVISLPNAQSTKKAAPNILSIESGLKGLAIDLPWPLSKHKDQTIPLSVKVETEPQGVRLSHFALGDRFKAALSEERPSKQGAKLVGADVIFGAPSSTPATDISEIRVRGKLKKLHVEAWREAIGKLTINDKGQSAKLPTSIDVEVDELDIFRTTLSRLKINANRLNDGWLVRIDGADINGEIIAPNDYGLPVNLNFTRLSVPKQQSATKSYVFDPRTVRPFTLQSVSTGYGEVNLGRIGITVTRIEDGIRVAEGISEQGDFELRTEGSWRLIDNAHHSQFDIKLQGNSLAGLLGGFGYDVVNIEGGATDLELNARWDGTPLAFGLEKLSGHLALNIESGRFLDIEPGSGRLFGLLSLQTLPRRLSLDFNDLFTKGFTFDTIAGNFSIDQGNAYTNSLLMDGPSARIQVSGRTGLKEQDYDQRVTVTPALSNSIPVASALFGPCRCRGRCCHISWPENV